MIQLFLANTVKIQHIWTPQKIAVIYYAQILTILFYRTVVIHPKDADQIVNSVDPALFA